ncbi:MAG TPA: redoxin domain-containing protein [Stellaceae bacterium]|nr:redoxin domain-containing protein [Stellaceae bacterium]
MADPQHTAPYNNPDFEAHRRSSAELGDTLAARIGAPAPDFEAPLLDGGTFRLQDARGKRHVVLMMGAVTSPMTAIKLPEMNAVWRDFAAQGIDFYLVYVRESHPGETFPHHASMEQKLRHARELRRLEKPAFPMLVDSLDGHIHRSYGQWPVSLFVVHKDGRLVFRSTIAQPFQLRNFLTELIACDRHAREHPTDVRYDCYTESIVGHAVNEAEHHRVYTLAGPKSFEDYWRVFPSHRDKWPGPTK